MDIVASSPHGHKGCYYIPPAQQLVMTTVPNIQYNISTIYHKQKLRAPNTSNYHAKLSNTNP